MSPAKTSIQDYMTASPHTIRPGRTLADAHRIMREHRIRHLPVLEGGQLRGILSDRDIHLIETLKDVDPQTVPVEDAMSQDVYSVAPDAALSEVVTTMARRKLGSAVVLQGEKVVGIFTAVDALGALAVRLQGRPA
jgi:acetoin utilization protein AcuB